MPTITSGNTDSPVVMIAEKASEMIIQDDRGMPVHTMNRMLCLDVIAPRRKLRHHA